MSERHLLAARRMLLDREASRVVTALRAAGLAPLLLKGASTAAWLYPDELRSYGDVDLLVGPADWTSAVEVIRGLGYGHPYDGTRPSEAWSHEAVFVGPHAVVIDLHKRLLGCNAEPEAVWAALQGHRERLLVGGAALHVLDVPARALHMALHVASSRASNGRVREDLRRAVIREPLAVWEAAADLARELEATAGLSTGLRALPEGEAVARHLVLAQLPDLGTQLRMRGDRDALRLARLVEGSWRDWLTQLRDELVPSTTMLQLYHGPAARSFLSRFALRARNTAAIVRLPALLFKLTRIARSARRDPLRG